MRSTTAKLALCLAMLALAACATPIHRDYDATTDFGALRSFHVMEAPLGAPNDPREISPFAARRIRTAIAAELTRRGYREVGVLEADFVVGYHLVLDARLRVDSLDSVYGFHRRRGFGHGRASLRVREHREGTLVIDVADRESKQLTWRGWGGARLGQRPNPQRSAEVIDELVPEILAAFPPDAPMG